MITSSLRMVQTDLVDTRLNNYFLEHGYRYIAGYPGHERFWDPPFFYPAKNIGAYSDILLTIAPPYWALRACGVAPDTAFQIWMILLTVANYVAALIVFRRGFRLEPLGAVAAAFLFAFSAMRTDEITHQQLMSHFFTLWVLYAVLRWGQEGGGVGWVAAGAAGAVAQLYAGFYLGWFLLFAMLLCLFAIPFDPAWRAGALRGLKRDWLAILIATTVSALVLWPMMSHYLAASRELGKRGNIEVDLSIGDLRSWIYMGPNSVMYGWFGAFRYFYGIPVEQTHRKGLGIITSLVVLWGLAASWKRTDIRLVNVLGLLLFVFATAFARDYATGIAFGVLAVCVAEVGFGSRTRAQKGVLLATITALSLMQYSLVALLIGVVVIGLPVAAISYILLRPRTIFPALPATLICLTAATEFSIIVAAFGAISLLWWWWATRRNHREIPVRGYVIAAGLVIVLLLIFPRNIIFWRWVYNFVPGGSVIRVVMRAALFVLIPASIALGYAFDRLWSKGRVARIAVAILATICVLEQMMRLPAFDKQKSRAAIARLVEQIDPRWETFYYSPRCDIPRFDPHIFQIDAMWAALETRVPTINGYSGHMPPGWHELEYCYVGENGVTALLDNPLNAWITSRGLDPKRVGWVGPSESEHSLPK